MVNETQDSAGVKIPPPFIYLGATIIGAILSYFFPLPFLPNSAARVLGILLITLAVFILLAALRLFRRAKTNPEPWKPTTAIITDGIYNFSRNPIYLAFTLFSAGIAFLFNSIWILLLLVPAVLFIQKNVILREEKYLAEKFGKEYLNYKRRVRRWI